MGILECRTPILPLSYFGKTTGRQFFRSWTFLSLVLVSLMMHVWFLFLSLFLEYWNIRRGPHTPPPSTIMEAKVQPTPCWPMDGGWDQGSSHDSASLSHQRGIIHAGSHLLAYCTPARQDAYISAPKKLKVIAYPVVCAEPAECGALGFDGTGPMEFAQMEYDVHGPMIQTFDSIIFVQKNTHPREVIQSDELDAVALDNDEDGDTSCCVEAASCSTPPKVTVAAISVKILENHGNPDYTCLYRFRVHGRTSPVLILER